jgi:hypothetical protein
MALTLTLPHLGRGTSTKDHIVSILSDTWPLTLKRLHHEIRRRFASGVTYQAVYKTTHELVDQGVLARAPAGYQVNMKWLKHVHDFTEVVQSRYFSSPGAGTGGVTDVRGTEGASVLSFDTWFDAEKYLYYFIKHHLLHAAGRRQVCMHHRHEWRPLYYLRAEHNWVRSLLAKGHSLHLLCAGTTPTDRWAARFYRTLGAKARTGARVADAADLAIFDDYVVQLFIPPALSDALASALGSARHIGDLDLSRLAREVFERRSPVQMVINRDAALAEQLRSRSLRA